MAVIVHTAQGLGQPIRGTCLTSLGTTGIVASWHDGTSAVHDELVVPEFGTHAELTYLCKNSVASPSNLTVKVWGEVPEADAADMRRRWPQDIGGADFIQAGGLYLLLDSVVLDAPSHRKGGAGSKLSASKIVPLRGAVGVTLEATVPADHLVLARFVD